MSVRSVNVSERLMAEVIWHGSCIIHIPSLPSPRRNTQCDNLLNLFNNLFHLTLALLHLVTPRRQKHWLNGTFLSYSGARFEICMHRREKKGRPTSLQWDSITFHTCSLFFFRNICVPAETFVTVILPKRLSGGARNVAIGCDAIGRQFMLSH